MLLPFSVGRTNQIKLLQFDKITKQGVGVFECYTVRPEYLPTTPLYTKHFLLKADEVHYCRVLQFIYKNKLYITENVAEAPSHRLRRPQEKLPKKRTNFGRQLIEYQTAFEYSWKEIIF